MCGVVIGSVYGLYNAMYVVKYTKFTLGIYGDGVVACSYYNVRKCHCILACDEKPQTYAMMMMMTHIPNEFNSNIKYIIEF